MRKSRSVPCLCGLICLLLCFMGCGISVPERSAGTTGKNSDNLGGPYLYQEGKTYVCRNKKLILYGNVVEQGKQLTLYGWGYGTIGAISSLKISENLTLQTQSKTEDIYRGTHYILRKNKGKGIISVNQIQRTAYSFSGEMKPTDKSETEIYKKLQIGNYDGLFAKK